MTTTKRDNQVYVFFFFSMMTRIITHYYRVGRRGRFDDGVGFLEISHGCAQAAVASADGIENTVAAGARKRSSFSQVAPRKILTHRPSTSTVRPATVHVRSALPAGLDG